MPNQILPLIAAMWSLRSVPDYSQPRASHPDGVWRVEPCDPRPRRAEKMAKQLFFCNLTESDLRSDSPVV